MHPDFAGSHFMPFDSMTTFATLSSLTSTPSASASRTSLSTLTFRAR